MIKIYFLDRLIEQNQLEEYSYEYRNDTGENPYMSLKLIFPNGEKLIIEPGNRLDKTQTLDFYRK